MELDGSRDTTFAFWARLQRIQYDENPEIVRRFEALMTALLSGERVPEKFSSIASKHSHVIEQLNGIDANGVDPVATVYRDRLVASHLALANLVQDGDFIQDQDSRKFAMKNYIETWNDRYKVMSDLKEKFNWDFDVVE
ncbi:hypothetical protein [Rosistilla carotiformis]|nr:hypothetical protein [Rosistilla carotiformis]